MELAFITALIISFVYGDMAAWWDREPGEKYRFTHFLYGFLGMFIGHAIVIGSIAFLLPSFW